VRPPLHVEEHVMAPMNEYQRNLVRKFEDAFYDGEGITLRVPFAKMPDVLSLISGERRVREEVREFVLRMDAKYNGENFTRRTESEYLADLRYMIRLLKIVADVT
jgi:hypothetical protein